MIAGELCLCSYGFLILFALVYSYVLMDPCIEVSYCAPYRYCRLCCLTMVITGHVTRTNARSGKVVSNLVYDLHCIVAVVVLSLFVLSINLLGACAL
ncbi:hypothetical protein BKA93DRAFT_810469 [Sparassis latifolia]